jgi:DNA-binding NtrC family response regulator
MMRIRTNKEVTGVPVPMLRFLSEEVRKDLPSLLIVDDDEQVIRVSVRLLCGAWNIDTAPSAEAAVHLLRLKRYDAILSDFEMPDKNGLWLLRAARAMQPHTRRVLFSGSGPCDLALHLQSGLVHDFVSKPSGKEELIAALSSAIKRRPN